MSRAELLKKLQVTKAMRLWVENLPPGLFEDGELTHVGAKDKPDAAVLFVETPADVERLLPAVLGATPPEVLWFAYRKGAEGKANGLTRDVGWDSLAARDWRPVRSIAIDAN